MRIKNKPDRLDFIDNKNMARAHRHYEPGYVWHITQRCLNQEFFLKYDYFRKRWIYWLSESKKRFKLSLFNYMVTSNHIHLLAYSDSPENEIAKTMHLVSGRVAQEFNKLNKRKGSFWEDRYHSTAVQSNLHLLRCMVYIDMNMVRAGEVKHPREWPYCGYHEIACQKRNNKKRLIDLECLSKLIGMEYEYFQEIHSYICKEYLKKKNYKREDRWTENIAVGSPEFVENLKIKLK